MALSSKLSYELFRHVLPLIASCLHYIIPPVASSLHSIKYLYLTLTCSYQVLSNCVDRCSNPGLTCMDVIGFTIPTYGIWLWFFNCRVWSISSTQCYSRCIADQSTPPAPPHFHRARDYSSTLASTETDSTQWQQYIYWGSSTTSPP